MNPLRGHPKENLVRWVKRPNDWWPRSLRELRKWHRRAQRSPFVTRDAKARISEHLDNLERDLKRGALKEPLEERLRDIGGDLTDNPYLRELGSQIRDSNRRLRYGGPGTPPPVMVTVGGLYKGDLFDTVAEEVSNSTVFIQWRKGSTTESEVDYEINPLHLSFPLWEEGIDLPWEFPIPMPDPFWIPGGYKGVLMALFNEEEFPNVINTETWPLPDEPEPSPLNSVHITLEFHKDEVFTGGFLFTHIIPTWFTRIPD